MAATKTANRPTPPEEIEGEALLEWHRVCDELEAAGRLDKADRAVLTVYVEIWAVHRAATAAVAKYGPVIKFHTGVPAQSPFYKTQRETATLLRRLLADLGLTPAARGKGATSNEEDDLEI